MNILKADISFSPLHTSNVSAMEPTAIREGFLSYLPLMTIVSDGEAKCDLFRDFFPSHTVIFSA